MDSSSSLIGLQVVLIAGAIFNIYALIKLREFSVNDYTRIAANRDVQKGVHILGIFLPGIGIIAGLYWFVITKPKLEALRKQSKESENRSPSTPTNKPSSQPENSPSRHPSPRTQTNSYPGNPESLSLELSSLAKLHNQGQLNDEEFAIAKSHVFSKLGNRTLDQLTPQSTGSATSNTDNGDRGSVMIPSHLRSSEESEEILQLIPRMSNSVSDANVGQAVRLSQSNTSFSPSVLVGLALAQRVAERHDTESLSLPDAIKFFDAGASIGTVLFGEETSPVDLLSPDELPEFQDFVSGAFEDADFFCEIDSLVIDRFLELLPPAASRWLNSTIISSFNQDSAPEAVKRIFVSGIAYVGFCSLPQL